MHALDHQELTVHYYNTNRNSLFKHLFVMHAWLIISIEQTTVDTRILVVCPLFLFLTYLSVRVNILLIGGDRSC
jgi:hypothetical protein